MKGILTKLDNQWMVRYDTFQNDHSYPLPAYNFLPLHPEYQTILPLDLDLEGKEVEFDWCVIVDHDTGKGKEYAKLIDATREQTNGERFEEFMRTVEGYPELEGIMNLCNDMINKRTGKMTEEEWQAAERAQTSKTKMTSIEWLTTYIKGITSLNCDEVINKALEMYKQETEDAYEEGYNRAAKVIEDETQRVLKGNI